MSSHVIINNLKSTVAEYRAILDKETQSFNSCTIVKGSQYILVDHDMPRSIKIVNGNFINAPVKIQQATLYSKTEAKEFAEFFGHEYVHLVDFLKSRIQTLEGIIEELS